MAEDLPVLLLQYAVRRATHGLPAVNTSLYPTTAYTHARCSPLYLDRNSFLSQMPAASASSVFIPSFYDLHFPSPYSDVNTIVPGLPGTVMSQVTLVVTT